MKYMLGFLKIIILCMLIVVSVYQTGKLWFEETSDRNFFYDGSKTVSTAGESVLDGEDFLIPQQMGVYVGAPDIEYSLVGKGVNSYDNLLEAAAEVIGTTLSKGTYVGVVEDMDELWTRHLMLVLPFAYSGDDLTTGYGVASSKAKDIEDVATFFIVPAPDDARSLHLYMEDSKGGIYEYQINSESVFMPNEVINYYIEDVAADDSLPAYISTLKNSLALYGRTMLLPMDGGDGQGNDIPYHSSIIWDVPYVSEGELDLEGIRLLVRAFFSNPDLLGIAAYEDEVRITSNDYSVSVRYNMQGILNYTAVTEATGPTVLTEAVAYSNNFVEKINRATDVEYYLADYEETEEGTYIYYNMGYNGFPVVLDSEAVSVYGMAYAAQVLVKGQDVVKFRALVRDIPDILPQFEMLDMPYGTALDNIMATIGSDDVIVQDMYLGYLWNEEGARKSLHWVVEVDGVNYYQEVGGQ